MKYFTKYIIQQQGKIKVGDVVLFTSTDGSYDKIVSEDHIQSTDKLVKLCLCSRDIQVGDKLKECCVDNKERIVDHFETVLPFGIWSFEKEQEEKEEWIRADQAFKVIAEVSEGALSFIEVELIDKENVRFLIMNGSFKAAYADIYEEAISHSYYEAHKDECHLVAEIKCPHCKHFH